MENKNLTGTEEYIDLEEMETSIRIGAEHMIAISHAEG